MTASSRWHRLAPRVSTEWRHLSQSTRVRRMALAAIVVVLAAAPLVLDTYAASTLARILLFALLAASLDLLVGITGLPSLGHGAYFGAGAYAAGFAALHGIGAPLALAAAVAAAALVAVIAGSVAVRAHGVFFLMLTLAVGEIVEQLAVSWEGVTGGSNGLYGIPALIGDGRARYLVVLAIAAAGIGAIALIAASPLGATLRGIRDNEPRMRALGYRVYAYKLAAFVVAGAAAGLAGGLLAGEQRLVTPADLGYGTSVPALLAVIIGGEGTLWGPAIGAAIVVGLRDYLGPSLGGHGGLVLGLVFVVVVFLVPGGLARVRA
jgi:branched-chain amino acid transport system permease protein